MNKTRILTILLTLVFLLAIPFGSVFADEMESLPDPGITPDSPFYFMDKWGQSISMMFTFGLENKMNKSLQFAEEKLAELEAMAAQNKAKFMERAAKEYRHYLDTATQNMAKAMDEGMDPSEQVTTMMAKHISIMYSNNGELDENCLQITEQTRQRAEICQKAALEALAEQDPEKAVQLNLALMEQQCTRLRSCIDQDDHTELGYAFQQWERLQNMNKEITAQAEQSGKGTQVQQMIQQATDTQNEILTRARNQLQLQVNNEGLSETPLQNQVREQEQLKIENGNVESTTTDQTNSTISSGNYTNPINVDDTGMNNSNGNGLNDSKQGNGNTSGDNSTADSTVNSDNGGYGKK